MILTSTKGGSVVTENQKEGRGSLKTLAGFREGTTQICMKKGRHGGGGGGVSRKSSKVIRGNHFSEVTFKFHLV